MVSPAVAAEIAAAMELYCPGLTVALFTVNTPATADLKTRRHTMA
jgi:hypothetical protein